MKYNLKNRPSTAVIQGVARRHEFDVWFEGFEAKHRRFLSKGVVEDWLKTNTLAEPTNEVITVIQTFVAKEILGEVK